MDKEEFHAKQMWTWLLQIYGCNNNGRKSNKPEPTYKDDDYDFIYHADKKYNKVKNLRCDEGPKSISDKPEIEYEYYFTIISSDWQYFGFNQGAYHGINNRLKIRILSWGAIVQDWK